MNRVSMMFAGLLLLGAAAPAMASECSETLNFSKRPLAGGEPVRLCDQFQGQVLLVVNTASKCGFTPQYEGLEALYSKYRERGLSVVGFPSNDFGGQEPGTEKQIQQFCRLTYGVKFPMFEKTRVIGSQMDPFYRQLTRESGEAPGWNFHKYLIDREGRVVASFPSRVRPESPTIVEAIEKLL